MQSLKFSYRRPENHVSRFLCLTPDRVWLLLSGSLKKQTDAIQGSFTVVFRIRPSVSVVQSRTRRIHVHQAA